MARNGSGSYVRPAISQVVTGTTITKAWWDGSADDMATALSNSIATNGETPVVANLPMGTYRHTGVGNAVARTDYAAAGQVQDGAFTWCGTAGGTANALTLTPTPAITAYAAGQTFVFKAGASSNTSTTTVAISGLTTIAVQMNGAACAGNEILASKWYAITLDSSSTCQVHKLGTIFSASTPAALGSASAGASEFAARGDHVHALSAGSTATAFACSNLQFPATQVPSSNANNLDDYEEGTWTPVPTSLTVVGTPTYSGTYTKIGRKVFLQMAVLSTTSTASTTNVTNWSGSPFVPRDVYPVTAVLFGSGIADCGAGAIVPTTGIIYTPTWAANPGVYLSMAFEV